jgi:pimeloyl-ACP methyl ester carboxylesterase
MSANMKTAALATGVTLPFVEQGDPGGLPVIFLHGITDSHRSYQPLLDALPKNFRAFALTQRGHGDASRPADHYRPEDMAADVKAFMDAKGVERAVIAGHSMGSIVARAFAHANPKRVAGLALVGAFSTLHNKQDVLDLCAAVDALADPVGEAFVRDFQVSTIGQPVPDAFLDMVVAESMKLPAFVWRAAFAGLVERDRTFTGSGVGVPTLIAWGERDVFCLRGDQDALLAALKNARLIVYEGVGHAVHWEVPVRFAADLVSWLREVERSVIRRAA